jgi:hypothetical protein
MQKGGKEERLQEPWQENWRLQQELMPSEEET